MKNKSYAVIFTYSFDADVSVYTFPTWEKAFEFLEASYNEELRINREENGWDSDGFIDKKVGYAKISNWFNDGKDVTEMRIGNVYA